MSSISVVSFVLANFEFDVIMDDNSRFICDAFLSKSAFVNVGQSLERYEHVAAGRGDDDTGDCLRSVSIITLCIEI